MDLLSTAVARAAKLCVVASLAKWYAPVLLVWNTPQALAAAFGLASEAIPVPLVSESLHHSTSMDRLLATRALTQVPLCLHWVSARSHNWRSCSHTPDEAVFIVSVFIGKLNNAACPKGLVNAHPNTCNTECWIINAQAMPAARHTVIDDEVLNDLLGARSHAAKPETLAALSGPGAVPVHSITGSRAVCSLVPDSPTRAQI